ncbi:YutD family protein [Secundilactobacillus folii]|uniref:DUF1027 domain-containing protein n=1 Tax=Secundilactobacillus folii TaxID=2678357 RepID=A0A7X3C2U6_9LACO|nr:YutD family protein [Secundilactobacillus folii]MTV83220.1 DUF1027 domain-containing protein [Secundilactobacillus folii]
MDKKSMQELIDDARAKREPGGIIVVVDDTHYQINEHPYELLVNYHDAFDRIELSDRFNTYFSRYDYLVGDWGFGQLRLRGFYDDKRNVAGELKISALQDYLNEVCNTGCPYFVMHNEEAKAVTPKRNHQRENNQRGRNQDGNRRSSNSRNQRQNSSTRQTNAAKRGKTVSGNRSNNRHQQNNGENRAPNQQTGSSTRRRSNNQQSSNQHRPNASGNTQNDTRQRNNGRGHTQNDQQSGNSQSSRGRAKRVRNNGHRNRRAHSQQKAYTVEKIKPVNSTPVAERKGTVKTVGHSQHRKFTIREKED